MPAIAAIALGVAAAGTAASVAGAAEQRSAMHKQEDAQQQEILIQQQQDAQRKAQMELDATRRKREIVRQSIAARSKALAATVAGGGNTSSALPGAYGGISGQTNVNELGVNQNQEIGENMFALNEKKTIAQGQYAQAQGDAASGAGLVSLGSMAINNSSTIAKIGGNIGGWFSPSTGKDGGWATS